ncbi:MAG: hypothetical protein ACQETB_01140 [Halobacteriota archaeon]
MGSEAPPEFDSERAAACDLLDDDSISAFFVGVVRDGDELDTTFAQRATDPQDEGLQALSLLAAHVRIVANQAGVDPATVAGDAATLAGRIEELSPESMRERADNGTDDEA